MDKKGNYLERNMVIFGINLTFLEHIFWVL